jgi:hypothetical protein
LGPSPNSARSRLKIRVHLAHSIARHVLDKTPRWVTHARCVSAMPELASHLPAAWCPCSIVAPYYACVLLRRVEKPSARSHLSLAPLALCAAVSRSADAVAMTGPAKLTAPLFPAPRTLLHPRKRSAEPPSPTHAGVATAAPARPPRRQSRAAPPRDASLLRPHMARASWAAFGKFERSHGRGRTC